MNNPNTKHAKKKETLARRFKLLFTLWRMMRSEKWLVVTINNGVHAEFIAKNFYTLDSHMVANELIEMTSEINDQENLVRMFQNN